MAEPEQIVYTPGRPWEDTPIGLAPCDIYPDDVITVDLIQRRIVNVERDGLVIYEANNAN